MSLSQRSDVRQALGTVLLHQSVGCRSVGASAVGVSAMGASVYGNVGLQSVEASVCQHDDL